MPNSGYLGPNTGYEEGLGRGRFGSVWDYRVIGGEYLKGLMRIMMEKPLLQTLFKVFGGSPKISSNSRTPLKSNGKENGKWIYMGGY